MGDSCCGACSWALLQLLLLAPEPSQPPGKGFKTVANTLSCYLGVDQPLGCGAGHGLGSCAGGHCSCELSGGFVLSFKMLWWLHVSPGCWCALQWFVPGFVLLQKGLLLAESHGHVLS